MHEQIVFADCWKALTQYRRGRYICPACAGHNLTFSRSGAWNCWNDPSRTHRLEIMAALGVKLKRSIPQPEPEYDLNIAPNIDPIEIESGLIVGGDIEQMVDFNADRFTGIVRQMLSTRSIDHPSELTNLFNYYSP
jgi:hypothetical protein